MFLEYQREKADENEFLLELGNDHSLENIERVVKKRIYKKEDDKGDCS